MDFGVMRLAKIRNIRKVKSVSNDRGQDAYCKGDHGISICDVSIKAESAIRESGIRAPCITTHVKGKNQR